MKQISIIGNLGADAQATKKTQNKQDTYIISFNIAVTQKYKDSNNVDVTNTDWFSVFLRRKKADTIMPYLKKGNRVFVQGSPNFAINDKDGKQYLNITVNCDKLELLTTKQNDT